MKYGKIILTAAIALCASSAAMAQNWTGFYVGVNAGHAWAKSDVTTNTTYSTTGYFTNPEVAAVNANGSGRVKPSGFTGGVTLGYNWHFGHGFFGLEGDYNHFSQDDSRTVTFADPFCVGCTYTLRQNVDVSHLASFRARGGWANPHWLVYATAGAAHTKYSYSEVFTDTFANAYESSSQSRSTGGFVWGGGAEVKLGKHWSLKGEWLHSHFSNTTGTSNNLTAYSPTQYFPSNEFRHSADLSVDMARVGVNFKF